MPVSHISVTTLTTFRTPGSHPQIYNMWLSFKPSPQIPDITDSPIKYTAVTHTPFTTNGCHSNMPEHIAVFHTSITSYACHPYIHHNTCLSPTHPSERMVSPTQPSQHRSVPHTYITSNSCHPHIHHNISLSPTHPSKFLAFTHTSITTHGCHSHIHQNVWVSHTHTS